MSESRKVLMVFLDETDRHGDSTMYETIVRRLLARGIAGATVNRGIMGYGAQHRVHHRRLLGVSDDRPVTVTAVDTEEKLRAVAPELRELAGHALILLLDAEVVL